jgi:HlyD family secretion protein
MATTHHSQDCPRRRRVRWLGAAVVGGAGLVCAFGAVFQTEPSQSIDLTDVTIVEADQGDVASVLTENGCLESTGDDTVRCQVESFLRLPVPAPTGEYVPKMAPIKSSIDLIRALPAAGSTRATAMARVKAQSDGRPSSSGSGSGKTGAQVGGHLAAAGASSAIGSSAAPASPGFQRPQIRSFDHEVEPYIPVRSATPDPNVILTAPPQPPTILSVVPEGTYVKAGAVVCEIDSSVFRDALPVQQARTIQAKAWLDQARYILEANEIALREYQEGVLPQDVELIRDYIRIREIEAQQAKRIFAWSRATTMKGFRTPAQLEADAAALEEAQIVLRDAHGMLAQLQNHTGKRILTAHKAKLAAIHADLFSLESAYGLESGRLRRIEAAIASCTMRAPRDGVVVYANRVNGWGGVERQIREGLAVYKSQPIFRLLDPSRMQIKALINESQVARVKFGQTVSIHFEAMPDLRLRGSIVAITPFASLLRGPLSDVHNYVATVKIESGGVSNLREGLSAELKIEIDTRHRVTRIPLESVRWVGEQTFVALATTTAQGPRWLWKPVELGVADTSFAEVVSGLEPGDRVIAESEELPPPDCETEGDEPGDAVAMDDSAAHR